MGSTNVLSDLAEAMASVIPSVDARTEGRYGPGLGPESEERQLDLILSELEDRDERYQGIRREEPYPNDTRRCDLVLDGIPIEVKLIRYWRANGAPEPHWYTHVFSPFHENTLLTDARNLQASSFDRTGGLLGLFYQRAEDDPVEVAGAAERFSALHIAEKVVDDFDDWFGGGLGVCKVAEFEGLQHEVHERGAVIAWGL